MHRQGETALLQTLINALCLWNMVEWFKLNHEQAQYINWNLPIQVCQSAAGYYIGQLENGMPYSRLSCNYFPTYEIALDEMFAGTFEPKTWL